MKKITFILCTLWCLLSASTIFAFNRQDTLRGSNGSGRNWWNVLQYSLSFSIDTAAKSISGSNKITAKIISKPIDSLQLDLQDLMFLDSVVMNKIQLDFTKEGNVWWIKYPFSQMDTSQLLNLKAYYHGKPKTAVNPPWDGGFIWTKDSAGNPWIAVACQGLGASSWWPCKDYQGDEPDSGMEITVLPSGFSKTQTFTMKESHANRTAKIDTMLEVISNGKGENIQIEDPVTGDIGEINKYKVKNPINTYNATFYIGEYISWTDTLMGEKGILNLSFYALRYNEEKAKKQFAVVRQMLHCFEYWMGPYPFYEDGYKLVEAPYLGMEHQSAVAYGNKYKMGYLGKDRSGTGVGLLFDFIIVHESGHEWFGNNITALDIADNWLHEGFTTYTEALFAECAFGKEKAFEYTTGEWKNIRNDTPVIGSYEVNTEGSSDIYDKGAAVVHMIRMTLNDDEKFRQLLRGLNKDFYHKIVTSAEVEAYINKISGYNFTPLFNQYLRTTQIPKLEWYIKNKKLFYRFTDAVDGFNLPILITSGKKTETLHVTSEWQSMKWKNGFNVEFSKNFLIKMD